MDTSGHHIGAIFLTDQYWEGHIHAATASPACPDDEPVSRLLIGIQRASALEQGALPQNSSTADDEPTGSRRHHPVDVGKKRRFTHASESIPASLMAQNLPTPCAAGYQTNCELAAKSAFGSSGTATPSNRFVGVVVPGDNGCESGASPPSGRATPTTPASSHSIYSSASSTEDDSSHRRKRKQAAFKSPLPLMEATLSILSHQAKTKSPRACDQGISKCTWLLDPLDTR